MAALPHAVPRLGTRSNVGFAGQVLAAIFVIFSVIVSAAVVSGQPSGEQDCVREICPR